MMSSSSSKLLGGAPSGLSSNWHAKTAVQVAGCTPEVPSFFTWQEPAGIDFEAEIESVSQLFPHLEKDVLQRHLSMPDEDVMLAMPSLELQGEDDDALVEKQALVCGETLLKFNEEAVSETSPGSPEQCLMSPSDALALSSLASPPNLMSPESNTDVCAGVKPVTLPAVKAACSPTLRTARPAVSEPSAITSPARRPPVEERTLPPAAGYAAATDNVQTIIEHVSPQQLLEQAVHQALSGPAVQDVVEVSRKCGAEDDEHSRMIDQALEDLKTLESMCGISASVAGPTGNAPSLHGQTSTSPALASSGKLSSAASSEKSLSMSLKSSANVNSAAVKSCIPPLAAFKQEPVEDDDVQIVEEVVPSTPQKPRRTRPPKIAITPARIAPVVAQPASQIVIVLTEDQLANIQKSGQLVLNAASLQAMPRGEPASSTPPKKVAAVRGQVRSAPGPMKRTKPERPSPVATVTSAKPQQRKANNKEPLSGWTPQKQQLPGSSEWAFPMMPPALDDLPAAAHAEVDDGLPDDLQDLFMDSPSVSSLPGDDANSILEDLISGSVREHPQLFGDSSPPGDDGDLMAACSPEQFSPQSVDLMPSPGFGADFSPNPQQVPVESWSPGLSPQSTDVCLSPRQYPGGEPVAVADWSPLRESPPSRRRGARPRPYDKPEKGGTRKPPLSDEERRQRKKEQNKNAATRYRQKKKEEHELVSGDQDMLESRNKQLRSKVAGLTKELNYLRGLMREVLRHRSADK